MAIFGIDIGVRDREDTSTIEKSRYIHVSFCRFLFHRYRASAPDHLKIYKTVRISHFLVCAIIECCRDNRPASVHADVIHVPLIVIGRLGVSVSTGYYTPMGDKT